MLDALIEIFRKQLENQFLTGGVALVVFTAILALLRNLPRHLWYWLERRIITTVDISDHDPAFYWVQKWLGEQPYTKHRARILTASTRTRPVSGNDAGPTPDVFAKAGAPPIDIVFSPAPGTHLLRFRGHFVLLTRDRRSADTTVGTVAYHETLIFRAFSRQVIRDIIFEARVCAYPPEDNRVTIFKADWGNWRVAQRRDPRPCESVVLQGTLLQDLIEVLKQFFSSKQLYADLGIPYQLGFLFYGEPGNGKTSAVVALASLFKRDIYMLSLSVTGDQQLSSLIGNLPEHAFLLIEDIDCLFNKRESTVGREDLTFSGFINAVDGVSSPPGRVVFMTTNHLDKLDPALIRPGRIDSRHEFKNADPDMATRLFLRFFPDSHEQATAFGKQISGESFSMAALQEHLMRHRKNPKRAARRPGA